MNAGGAGCLRITAEAQFLEHAFEHDGDLLHGGVRRLDRIEIEHQKIRRIEMLDPRHPWVLLNVSGVGDVEQLIPVGPDEVTNGPLDVRRPDLLRAYPGWRVV